MASFLLIHGSWHGGWCWERLTPILRERGHEVIAVDLPGHGDDDSPAWRVTAADYSETIRAAADRCEREPILVGHSMGGLAITRAAADAPELFSQLVYLCAWVPLGAITLIRLMRADRETLVPTGSTLGWSCIGMRADRAPAIFYGECAEADAAWAIAKLRPDPIRPLLRSLRPREINLPRTYIKCTKDRAIPIAMQRELINRARFDHVETLDTDHSPFLSAPAELAEILDRTLR